MQDINDKDYTNKKVLIAEDDKRNIFALSSMLEERGIQIVIAENGIEVLSSLQKDPDFDLVLMDIMMPEMDGYEAIREIRKLKHFKNLPIIALTANAMKGDREKCMNAGATDYLSKPIDLDRFIHLLNIWL